MKLSTYYGRIDEIKTSDSYNKFYSDIDRENFDSIVKSDPTYVENTDHQGKYTKWLLNIYKNGDLRIEDLYKATEYLEIFHKVKSKLIKKDINQYKNLVELYESVKKFIGDEESQMSKSELEKHIKSNEAEKFYEDNEWLIIIPKTERVSCYYGKGTQWCTASEKSNNFFNSYNKKGDLYVNINKRSGRKYQLHLATGELMDEANSPIEIEDIMTIDTFKKIYKEVLNSDAFVAEIDLHSKFITEQRLKKYTFYIIEGYFNQFVKYLSTEEIFDGLSEYLDASNYIVSLISKTEGDYGDLYDDIVDVNKIYINTNNRHIILKGGRGNEEIMFDKFLIIPDYYSDQFRVFDTEELKFNSEIYPFINNNKLYDNIYTSKFDIYNNTEADLFPVYDNDKTITLFDNEFNVYQTISLLGNDYSKEKEKSKNGHTLIKKMEGTDKYYLCLGLNTYTTNNNIMFIPLSKDGDFYLFDLDRDNILPNQYNSDSFILQLHNSDKEIYIQDAFSETFELRNSQYSMSENFKRHQRNMYFHYGEI